MTDPAPYRAALEGAALVDESAAGRIVMRGRDRAALLHRLSTNDIEQLRPGQGTRTVLTTPIGRIIDLLAVHALDDELLLVTSQGQGPPVYRHLKSNIFFNDQVTLAPAGATHAQIALYGPRAPEVLARLGAPAAPQLALHGTLRAALAGIEALVARREPLGGNGFTLYIPAQGAAAVRAALTAEGVVTLDAESLDVLRIEQGYGVFGRELSQEYIPLEAGLLDAVSFTKGCYVGQEIIARMESRGRLAKRLVGLRLTEGQGPGTEDERPGAERCSSVVSGLASLVLPAKLEVNGKDAGVLTSAALSPRHGPIALAYVRTAYAEPGACVSVTGAGVTGEVVELPFGGPGTN